MDNRFGEPRHPIGVAAERTGLSTDVIRAWERRYGATEPVRDEAGQRLYSDADVERLRLLRRVTDAGRAIGQVATLGLDALMELARGDEEARAALPRRQEVEEDGVAGSTVAELERRALALDGEGLEVALRALLLDVGFVRFTEGVAGPLLRRLGDGWHAGEVTPSQEHVASAAVRRVLESAREAPAVGGNGPAAVVGTLPGERHETGALAAAAAARLAGWRVVYLGADLPVPDLADAAARTGARAVCVSATFRTPNGLLVSGLRALRAALPEGVELYAGGPAVAAAREVLEGHGVRCPGGVESLREALQRQAEREAGGGGGGPS